MLLGLFYISLRTVINCNSCGGVREGNSSLSMTTLPRCLAGISTMQYNVRFSVLLSSAPQTLPSLFYFSLIHAMYFSRWQCSISKHFGTRRLCLFSSSLTSALCLSKFPKITLKSFKPRIFCQRDFWITTVIIQHF